MMREDKQKICDLLLPALQETGNLYDLVELRFDREKELVFATFANGHTKRVNVACDSGTAMIRDIIKQIV
jgi:hypothetical protein